MSAKAIREYHGKKILSKWLSEFSEGQFQLEDRTVLVTSEVVDPTKKTFQELATQHPWLLTTQLVVKPDQLIKRRGKAGLLAINKTWEQVQEWIMERMQKEVQVEVVKGILDHFIVEPFVPHQQTDEYYLCIQSFRECDEFLFYHEGGVDVGDVDSKGLRLRVPVGEDTNIESILSSLLIYIPDERKNMLAHFLYAMLQLYRKLNFTYLEINPLVVVGDRITPLDLAAKIDQTADFLNQSQWGEIDFPAPFGRAEFPEEAYIRELDSKTGASLKLTILNQNGRVWTMVAGGGASVVYADTISDYGYGHELANYGEYSGAPSTEHTFEYAKTILKLMVKTHHPQGKILIIGGGIANFTDVAATFTGIIKALNHFAEEIKEGQISIWIRRAGPNFQEGLKKMRDVQNQLGLDMHIYGPETHVTAVVPMALGIIPVAPEFDEIIESTVERRETMSVGLQKSSSSVSLSNQQQQQQQEEEEKLDTTTTTNSSTLTSSPASSNLAHSVVDMTKETRAIVYGLQERAVQGMLDFDYMCKRKRPSVAAMVFPFAGNHYAKFYWGTSDTLIPVYESIELAARKHPDVTVMINFASFRSVYETTMETLNYSDQIKTVAIIAEGVPESQTRTIIKAANNKGVGLIGPATVGGIKPGAFRIGNTGGMLDNILMAKLYRPGSVAYVSKSGGMSNELNNIICRNSDGVYEGVAIGGDRYPGSRFIDHLLRYNDNPEVKMMVLLGEVGGTDEYEIADAIKSKRITKPLIAWCIGTCASIFPFEVQFGHAGACARGDIETALAKNKALREAGAIVPDNFDKFPNTIADIYKSLVDNGTIIPKPEPETPKVPMDYTWAKNLGLIRKPASFVSSICDDRGDELKYAGMPISEVFEQDIGVGGVVSLLWFRRRLPPYATKFIEMIIMVTADHGPAVSGAHNTIVATRAGKDLVSSLVSGLLTIGPRFGGALDEAARMFYEAADQGISPADFVNSMRTQNKLIMGIGHRIKSLSNPDKRVTIIKEYAKKHFKENKILNFALEVEQITTKKRNNLILNVDGCIAVCFVDLLRSCGAFTIEDVNELVEHGCMNGLFVLGRSIGFIGHYLDQNRLKQGLYRHPWDDISYLTEL